MQTGDILYIGAPIGLLLISMMAFIFVAVEIKKRRLELKSIVGWLVVNIFYTIVLLYILIDAILQYFGISNSVNIFTWFARNVLGFKWGGQEWIIILIFAFISFILIITMINSIKVQRLNRRVDELNREIAILGGKVNKTAKFSATEVAVNPKTIADIKKELKSEFKIAKAKQRQEAKLTQLKMSKPKVEKIEKVKSKQNRFK